MTGRVPKNTKFDTAQHRKDMADLAEKDTVRRERANVSTDDIDGLLEEIDACLEENAYEFVAGYVQKGGQ